MSFIRARLDTQPSCLTTPDKKWIINKTKGRTVKAGTAVSWRDRATSTSAARLFDQEAPCTGGKPTQKLTA
jgi:hypothetical protein